MEDIIKKFGGYVDSLIENNPKKARKLLIAAYKAKNVQNKHFPNKDLFPSRNYGAKVSTDNIIKPMKNPEKSAVVSIFTPCEILHAMGIIPMIAEGVSAYLNGADAERGFAEYAESFGVSETYCSYHKVLMGAAFSGVIEKPSFIVNTSLACDANNLTFKTLADFYGIDAFYIDVPYEYNRDAVNYVSGQLKSLASFVEEHAGKKMDEERLREALTYSANTISNLKKCHDIKYGRYLKNDVTSEMYEVFMNHVLLGTEDAERYSEMLLRDIEGAEGYDGLNLIWMHTIPNYQIPVRELLNVSRRCQIISCDMNFDNLLDVDVDNPYDTMAERLLLNSFNGPSKRRIERAISMCRKQHADGVVYFCHWGCKHTMGGAHLAKKMIEDAGFPVLILDGDGCDRVNSSDGQTSTRLNAFIEMLEERKNDILCL